MRPYILISSCLFYLMMALPGEGNCQLNQTDSVSPGHQPGRFNADRLFIGGNTALRLGTLTAVECSPAIQYYIEDNISVGLGLNYQYVNDKFYYPTVQYNVWGGRLFANALIIDGVFAHVEYQYLVLQSETLRSLLYHDSYDLNSFLVGPGFKQTFSSKFHVFIMLLWDTNYDAVLSPYTNPVIRTGLYFAL